jgi:predicted RNA-binding protein YlxR (DUF448 family)
LRPRHVPQRTCVGCRSGQAKRGLIRIVRGPDSRVRVDPTGKAPGRGAYLCQEADCWRVALQRGKLAQALRVTLLPEDRVALERYRDDTLAVASAETT